MFQNGPRSLENQSRDISRGRAYPFTLVGVAVDKIRCEPIADVCRGRRRISANVGLTLSYSYLQ